MNAQPIPFCSRSVRRLQSAFAPLIHFSPSLLSGPRALIKTVTVTMVNLTSFLCKYRPHWLLPSPNSFTPDKRAFRRKQLFELTKNYHGRRRDCYKLAVNMWRKTLLKSAHDRRDKKYVMRDLYSQRIWAGLQEHRFPYKYFLGVMPRMGIELDRRVLAHMVIWEPRTFAALTNLCRAHVAEKPIGEASREISKPDGVITRGML